jgi:hypothetical protein
MIFALCAVRLASAELKAFQCSRQRFDGFGISAANFCSSEVDENGGSI